MTKYQKGDYIKYSSAGVCLIEDIKMIDYTHSKNEQEFYVLKPVGAATSTIYVPVENEKLTSKMRYILKKDEIDGLIKSIKKEEITWIEDRKIRSESFKDILKRCDPQELLRLVSCIYLKKKEIEESGKRLSATDDSVLSQAEAMIENEFAFVLNLSGIQLGEYIREKLEIE